MGNVESEGEKRGWLFNATCGNIEIVEQISEKKDDRENLKILWARQILKQL